ncbi:hypothetical protein Tco_0530686 [Tanacetum coccineum]
MLWYSRVVCTKSTICSANCSIHSEDIIDLGISSLASELMLLVQSYNCSKIKTAERVSTVKREWIKTEERIKIDWRSRLLT